MNKIKEEQLKTQIKTNFYKYCSKKNIYPLDTLLDLFIEGVSCGITITEDAVTTALGRNKVSNLSPAERLIND